MITYKTGWILDIYAHQRDGLIVWMMMAGGQRFRLRYTMPVTFYVAGPNSQLHDLSVWLITQNPRPHLSRVERRDIFNPNPLTLLGVQVENPAEQPGLFRRVERRCPSLTYYDTDIDVGVRFAALTGAFPMTYCRFKIDDDQLISVRPIESRWEMDPRPCPLRVLEMEPDCNPNHSTPKYIKMTYGRHHWAHPIENDWLTVRYSARDIRKLDPDVILTTWGDTWMLPMLIEMAQESGEPLHINREDDQTVVRKAARTYMSYGQIIHRGQQVHLRGRLHIDRANTGLWGDYGLDGVMEVSRITGLSMQKAARVSPGTSISSMEIITALQTGVLVSWHKQQGETEKSAKDLIKLDQGGMVYQPILGLHRDVGEIDYVSIYPGVMVRCNISPECVPVSLADPQPEELGIVPATIKPLIKKRISLKTRLISATKVYSQQKSDKARSQSIKDILVTSFGYLGYKNNPFGQITSHEAVSYNGRKALLQAKNIAEEKGYRVLQMYVDGLWLQRPGAKRIEDFTELLDEIADRTGITIALDGIYRWIAFLPSRSDPLTPVPNRYFGVFQDGSIKARGIEIRRSDTPKIVRIAQAEALLWLAKAQDVDELPQYIPGAIKLLRNWLHAIRDGYYKMDDLVISQKLTQELDQYVMPSPAARAAKQLRSIGQNYGPGQHVKFVFVLGDDRVHAWDLPNRPDPRRIDRQAYRVLLLRAAQTILQPFGIEPSAVEGRLEGHAVQLEF